MYVHSSGISILNCVFTFSKVVQIFALHLNSHILFNNINMPRFYLTFSLAHFRLFQAFCFAGSISTTVNIFLMYFIYSVLQQLFIDEFWAGCCSRYLGIAVNKTNSCIVFFSCVVVLVEFSVWYTGTCAQNHLLLLLLCRAKCQGFSSDLEIWCDWQEPLV